MRRKLLVSAMFLLLLAGRTVAHAQAKGELRVTATVVGSSAWVRNGDGNWVFVVANAPDATALTTVVGNEQKNETGRSAVTKEGSDSRRHLRTSHSAARTKRS